MTRAPCDVGSSMLYCLHTPWRCVNIELRIPSRASRLYIGSNLLPYTDFDMSDSHSSALIDESRSICLASSSSTCTSYPSNLYSSSCIFIPINAVAYWYHSPKLVPYPCTRLIRLGDAPDRSYTLKCSPNVPNPSTIRPYVRLVRGNFGPA